MAASLVKSNLKSAAIDAAAGLISKNIDTSKKVDLSILPNSIARFLQQQALYSQQVRVAAIVLC